MALMSSKQKNFMTVSVVFGLIGVISALWQDNPEHFEKSRESPMKEPGEEAMDVQPSSPSSSTQYGWRFFELLSVYK